MKRQSPSKHVKQQHQGEGTLYELPNCTICLLELSQNLFSLNCGHVFHGSCIQRHFHYKNTCPNCQKRCQQTEFRPVIMTFHSNNDTKFRQMINQVDQKDKKAFTEVMNKLKALIEINDKLTYQNESMKKTIQTLQDADHRLKIQMEKGTAQLIKLTQKNSILLKAKEQNNRNIFNLCNQVDSLKQQIEYYRKFEEQSKMFKRLKQTMEKNNEQVTKLKDEFVENNNPIQGMEYFYLKLMQEKLDTAKARKQTKMREQIIRQLKADNGTLRKQIEMQKTKVSKAMEEMEKQKVRGDKLKNRCTVLAEMTQKINVDSTGPEGSQEDAKIVKKTSGILEPMVKNTMPKGPSMIEQIGVFGGMHNRKKVANGGQSTLFG